MRYILLICFTFLTLQASNLLTYNVYERSDRVDVMLSFDAPHEGKIYQQQGKDFVSLVLENLEYTKAVKQSINSPIVQDLLIEPSGNSTVVTLKSKRHIGLFASKTLDGFGLRIRAKLIAPPIKDLTPTPQNQTKTSASSIVDGRYFTVIAIMLLLLALMYFLKWKLTRKNGKSFVKLPFNTNKSGINLLSQKAIDMQNKISLIEFNGNKYLVLTGNSNVLLDKYNIDGVSIETKEDFELLFEKNQQKLSKYLNSQPPNQLNAYKQKASQDYTENS